MSIHDIKENGMSLHDSRTHCSVMMYEKRITHRTYCRLCHAPDSPAQGVQGVINQDGVILLQAGAGSMQVAREFVLGV